jgi:hypothetical protein
MQQTGKSWLEGHAPAEPYVHQEYPKTLHHKSGKTVTVEDPAAAEKHLATGHWAESPAAFAAPEPDDDFAAENAVFVAGTNPDASAPTSPPPDASAGDNVPPPPAAAKKAK